MFTRAALHPALGFAAACALLVAAAECLMPVEVHECSPGCTMHPASHDIGVECGQLEHDGFCYYSASMQRTCDYRYLSCVDAPTSSSCAYFMTLVDLGQCPALSLLPSAVPSLCRTLSRLTDLSAASPPSWCNSVPTPAACNASYVWYEARDNRTFFQRCVWRGSGCTRQRSLSNLDVVYECAAACRAVRGRVDLTADGGSCHHGGWESGLYARLTSADACEATFYTMLDVDYPCAWRGNVDPSCDWEYMGCDADAGCAMACNCVEDEPGCAAAPALCCDDDACGSC